VTVAVTVKVVGDLRRFAPADTVEIEGGPCTVGVAVDELIRQNPRLRDQLFDGEGHLHYAMVLALNGRPASWPRDREAQIGDGGELLLTRFHSGG
jgi:hypothetical protein